jgi:hypothetical protein
MSIFQFPPEILDQVLLLSGEEKADPQLVLEQFFQDAHLHEYKSFLFDALEACLTTEEPPFENYIERSNAMFHAHCIMKCLEAVKIMVDRAKGTPTKPGGEPGPHQDKSVGSPESLDRAA